MLDLYRRLRRIPVACASYEKALALARQEAVFGAEETTDQDQVRRFV